MSVRLFFLALLSAASMAASAGPVEDLFRRLIEQRQATGQVLPGLSLANRVPEVTKPMILPRNDGLELGREQIAMFVQPGCRSCDAAAKRLAARGWKVELLDLGRSATARDATRAAQDAIGRCRAARRARPLRRRGCPTRRGRAARP